MAASIVTAASMFTMPVHATGVSEVLTPINNLKTLVLAIIGAVGVIILALLEMVFGFWNNQINLVFSLLGQSPVSFKGGGPWAVVENLQPFKSNGYREMVSEIRAREEAERKATVRKVKEERRRSRKEKIKNRIKYMIKRKG